MSWCNDIIECYRYQVIKLFNEPIYKYPLGSGPVPRTMPTMIGLKEPGDTIRAFSMMPAL